MDFYELDDDYIEYCTGDNPWHTIKSNSDIENFFKKYSFHDSYIESVAYISGVVKKNEHSTLIGTSHNMIITLNSCWYENLEMLFIKVREFHLYGWSDSCYGNEMQDGIIRIRNDFFGKTRDDRVIEYSSEYSCFIADGLKWRFAKGK